MLADRCNSPGSYSIALVRDGRFRAAWQRCYGRGPSHRPTTTCWGNAEWHFWKSTRSRCASAGIVALDGLSFEIDEGQILGLIGPNGAGKTTMFNVVSRIYDPTAGRLTFDGIDLLEVPAHGIAGTGIARSFQNLALFPTMTLLQNTMTGAHHRGKVGFTRAMLRLGVGREEKALAADAYSILEAPRPAATWRSARPPGCRSARSSGSSWPRALAVAPQVCCCSTSRRPVSPTRRSTSWARPSRRSATSSASPCCSSSTTWAW